MSILTHFALQFGVNIQDYPVSPSLLHIGIFLTFAPSLILFMSKNKNETDEKGKKLGLRILYRNSPKVLIGLTFIVYLYTILNFFIFMSSMPGSPAKQGEKYILSNHGKLIREINFEEYKLYQRKEAIGFSGHWMLFYAAAMLLSNPFRASRLKKS